MESKSFFFVAHLSFLPNFNTMMMYTSISSAKSLVMLILIFLLLAIYNIHALKVAGSQNLTSDVMEIPLPSKNPEEYGTDVRTPKSVLPAT